MKFDCELIQDLLPLYEEGLCSPASRQAVEEHLKQCQRCRRLTAPLPIEEPKELPQADRAVKKSIKKVRRRWLTSLLAAVLVFPLLLLSVNQYRGSGLSFTNLDDIYTAWRFLHALEEQGWETAARMHDFSGDYESILDALGMDVSSWGTTFTLCDLAGCDYAAHTHLERSGAVPGTLEELYGYLYNLQGTAMVPAEMWEELMALDPEAFSRIGGEYLLNGERYGKISTSWGDFVVSQGRGYDTAYDYAVYFDLIPENIYREALPQLEAEALQIYTNTHADVGWVAELTEAEFTEEMIRRYTADLTALADSVTFECTGYRSVDSYGCIEGGSCVFFDITVTQGTRVLEGEIQIHTKDGKIDVAGISHQPGVQWLDAIDRALYPSAHLGY